jgi:hypothetical protein
MDGEVMTTLTRRIDKVEDLQRVAQVLGVRKDWHEPDEQEVNAYVVGDHLDNAMGSTTKHNHGELNVVITHYGENFAVINLATLLSWAAS